MIILPLIFCEKVRVYEKMILYLQRILYVLTQKGEGRQNMGKRPLFGRAIVSMVLVFCFSLPSAASVLPPPDEEISSTSDNRRESGDVVHAHKSKVALKSNLLSFAVGAPNIGVEMSFGNHFSVAATGTYAWWRIKNTYALQTLQGGLDAKYWFNPKKKALTGWNVGVYGIYGGRWDVQWKKGWQGDRFFSTGITAGYAMPVTKDLNLEFALAAGWFHTTEARRYEIENGHLMWRQTRYNVDRFSLTKVQVNLVWLIGRNEK